MVVQLCMRRLSCMRSTNNPVQCMYEDPETPTILDMIVVVGGLRWGSLMRALCLAVWLAVCLAVCARDALVSVQLPV